MNHPFFKLDSRLIRLGEEAMEKARTAFAGIEEIQEYNQQKMLAAFIQNGVSESHFVGSTGYGYDDRGRETLDAVFAQAMGAEDALVRHNFVCGTHALTVALFGVLRPGDVMLSVTGKPYDTLQSVIGLTGDGNGTLQEFGIKYREVALNEQGRPDLPAIRAAVKQGCFR